VRRLFTTRRQIAIVGIAAAMVLAGGTAAFAYFTSSGSGTGSATVGSANTWSVVQDSASGTIYPGSGSSVITFHVTNNATGDQQFSTATPTVVSSVDGGYIMHGDTTVTGCLAAWFSASVTGDPAINTNIADGSTVHVNVKVTMPTDSSDNQDACEGATPDVTLAIS
jgi:hypothetical protein